MMCGAKMNKINPSGLFCRFESPKTHQEGPCEIPKIWNCSSNTQKKNHECLLKNSGTGRLTTTFLLRKNGASPSFCGKKGRQFSSGEGKQLMKISSFATSHKPPRSWEYR